MSYLSDRQIANVLANMPDPGGDMIAWRDDDKDLLIMHCLGQLSHDTAQELLSEISPGTSHLQRCIVDPLQFGIYMREAIYLELEPQLREQVGAARKLIAKNVHDDYQSGLKFAAQG